MGLDRVDLSLDFVELLLGAAHVNIGLLKLYVDVLHLLRAGAHLPKAVLLNLSVSFENPALVLLKDPCQSLLFTLFVHELAIHILQRFVDEV